MRGNSDPSAALLIGIIAGVWSFFKGFRVLREYKVLEDTPRIPIRSVPMGFVHIRGTAQSEKILSSPISHTPCCFYKVEIEQWKSSGKSHSWQHICTDMDGYRFYVADSTGKMLIDAHSAEYDLPETVTRVVNSQNLDAHPAPAGAGATPGDLLHYVQYAQTHSMVDRVGQFIDKRFEKARASDNPELQAKQQAFRELFAGIPQAMQGGSAPVNALAKLASLSGPLRDPEKEQKRQMFLQRLEQVQSLGQTGALPQNLFEGSTASGQFRLHEYIIVPGQEYLVDGTCCENTAAGAGDPTVIAKGHNEPTFLISAKTDKEVQQGLKKRAALMILGGAAVALACLAGLLVHLHLF